MRSKTAAAERLAAGLTDLDLGVCGGIETGANQSLLEFEDGSDRE